jgi:ubiquinone/menaquinone biosynthesis C-methylase UbiE
MIEYTIAQGLSVRERMDLLAEEWRSTTCALLDRVGIGVGQRCLDLGCGGAHVTFELARRVGPSGYVLGVDLDRELLDLATAAAAAADLKQVEFREGRVEDVAASDFDVVYARLLLMHIADPQAMLERMVAAVKPGGLVVVEDAHFDAVFTAPPCEANDLIYRDWYPKAVRRRGGDPNIGPRLPTLFEAARLECLGIDAAQPAHLAGPLKQLAQLSAETIRDGVISAGVAERDEFNRALAELAAFANHPMTLVAGPRLVQVWGQRRL